MTPERWEQVGQLYHDALELKASERAAFLDQACDGDEALRREVESLLAAEKEIGDFIAEPAFEEMADLIVSEEVSLMTGKKLGDYKILALLGRGGMGEVYLAHDPSLERNIAIKLLLSDFTQNENRVRRFIQEAKAVSALNHPNIITIHEIGEAEGRRYIATEFIEGQTLRKKMAGGKMKLAAALDTIIQIAGALDAAHSAGIVHRDIKPENIMVRPDGLIKVLDFGLAKLTENLSAPSEFDTQATTATKFRTEPGIIMGTVAYMSPEHVRAQDMDGRSDIFSLGVLFYELIVGRRPFTGETSNHVIVAILDHSPAPVSKFVPDIPDEAQRIVGKALQKERDQRYQTAKELLADLKSLRKKLELGTEATGTKLLRNEVETDGGQSPLHSTLEGDAQLTGKASAISTKTSIVRMISRFVLHKRKASIALACLIIAVAAVAFYFINRAPVLTDKDTVLLADFNNLTGDEVFDSMLKQALAVHLEQSPFLSFFPEERIRETLRYMGREPDERVTGELAREICQRQGVKAFLAGSIARFDRRYSITLEAINSQTGEVIARTLAEAENKDQVLRTLGRTATQLRERLGESLASIQKFDAPLEQATTSSLNAFKAWSRGLEMARRGKGAEAIPFYKHAKELDPNFAKADVSLSLAYSNMDQLELAAEYAAKAFALRERVTEREKFDITSNYYALSTGDLLKAIEAVELWKQTYPRDYSPPSRLSSLYRLVGRMEESLAAAREANQIHPRAYVPYVSIGTSLLRLNRIDEAQNFIEQALTQGLGTATSHRDLYQIGFIKNDLALMQHQIDWASESQNENQALFWQAKSKAFYGQLRQAQELYRRAATIVEPDYPERAAWLTEEAFLQAAVCGQCRQIRKTAGRLQASSLINLQSFIPAAASRALALAQCGELTRAQLLADEVANDNPQSTLANAIWLPVVRATIELNRGNYDLALSILHSTDAHESAALFWPTYLRGLIYLKLKSGDKAVAEFQKIIDNRGWDPTSPLWPLAHLGLARGAALMGDVNSSKQAYQTVHTLWKTADPDLPALIEAKKEFEQSK